MMHFKAEIMGHEKGSWRAAASEGIVKRKIEKQLRPGVSIKCRDRRQHLSIESLGFGFLEICRKS